MIIFSSSNDHAIPVSEQAPERGDEICCILSDPGGKSTDHLPVDQKWTGLFNLVEKYQDW